MEESTLLRIVRTFLEDIVLDDIKGEAEGISYELSELTFPSLNTTRCFCHLKKAARAADGSVVLGSGQGQAVSTNEDEALVRRTRSNNMSSGGSASSSVGANQQADNNRNFYRTTTSSSTSSTTTGGTASSSSSSSANEGSAGVASGGSSLVPLKIIAADGDGVQPKMNASGLSSPAEEHVEYFSITVKNLGLVLHHKWKCSGTMIRLEGENIVDVKDSRAEFVFAVTVREDGSCKCKQDPPLPPAPDPPTTPPSRTIKNNTLEVRIVSAKVELGELELAIANHDEAQSVGTLQRAWTSLLFGTLRRVLQRALQGPMMKEKLETLLSNLLQEKALKPLANAELLQNLLPADLAAQFLHWLHSSLPVGGVQL
ncbi:unnamed protein product [Amoebophrya sp. A25]|nr:unnamed protein product [Amoebophrya sp. A25]|eukprot:GSA25T00022962001.1